MELVAGHPQKQPRRTRNAPHWFGFNLPHEICRHHCNMLSNALTKGNLYVSRQSPNPRRRKRTAESPGGIQAVMDEKAGAQFYITSLDGKVTNCIP